MQRRIKKAWLEARSGIHRGSAEGLGPLTKKTSVEMECFGEFLAVFFGNLGNNLR